MDKELFEFMESTRKKESAPPATPPKESTFKYANNQKIIEEKRAELELKKLEIEIKKLEAPNTNLDYFQKMLEIQKQNFEQLLQMQKEHSSLLLEIEKLKLGGDDNDGMMLLLDAIKPILPQILALKSKTEGTVIQQDSADKTAPAIIEKGGQPMNREEYIKAVREGKITCEEAWEDFKLEVPAIASKMTYEQFKPQFEKIKNQKE